MPQHWSLLQGGWPRKRMGLGLGTDGTGTGQGQGQGWDKGVIAFRSQLLISVPPHATSATGRGGQGRDIRSVLSHLLISHPTLSPPISNPHPAPSSITLSSSHLYPIPSFAFPKDVKDSRGLNIMSFQRDKGKEIRTVRAAWTCIVPFAHVARSLP